MLIRISKGRGLLITMAVAMTLATSASIGPVALSADSPEGAVSALYERLGSGGLGDLEGVVCEEQVETLSSQLAQLTGGEPGAVSVEISDLVTSLVSEDGDRAVVHVGGTLRLTLDEARLRELARQSVVDSGEEPTDEAIEAMIEALGGFAGQATDIDDDIDVVRRDGEWLACPDVDGSAGASTETSSNLSDVGICGIVPVDELNAISPAPFDFSYGSTDACQWSASSADQYVSAGVNLFRGQTLEDYTGGFMEGDELEVGGRPALATMGQLFVEVDEGLLIINASIQDASGEQGDAAGLARQVAELVMPRLAELPINPLSDCSIIDPEGLDALRPVGFGPASGAFGSCHFEAYHTLDISLDLSGSIESMSQFMEGEDLEIGGLPAFDSAGTLWVQLPEGLLSVSAQNSATANAGQDDPEQAAYRVAVASYVIDAIRSGG